LETRITTLFSKTPVSQSIMDITSPLSKPIKRWIEP